MFNVLIIFICAFNLISTFMITNKIKSINSYLKGLSSTEDEEEKEIELM